MSFRKEIKFRLTNYEALSLKPMLYNLGMRKLYPNRRVNSIYFDNQDLSMFHDSEEGILPRKKIRLRWYDDDEIFSLETKISSFEGRFKTVEKFVCDTTSIHKIQMLDPDYGSLKPKLKVSYVRAYYTLEELRITHDSQIKYSFLQSEHPLLMSDGECVMEIKVPIEVPDDYIKKIIPYNEVRFSKYARGLLMFQKK